MIKKVISLIIFLIPLSLNGKEVKKKEYICYFINEAPVLDGKIEEPIWDNLPVATGFFILGNGYAKEKQTYFFAGWRKDAIYIGVKSLEDSPEKIKAQLKDGDPLWEEDGVEFFFLPEGAHTYLQFIVNAIGSRWNGRGLPNRTFPVWDWEVRTYIGKDFWSLEAKVPFTILGRSPKDGERWLINVARNICTDPTSERYTCWPNLKSSFHEVENFDILIFKEKAISIKEKDKVENKINFDYYLFLQNKIKEIYKNNREYKEIIDYAIKDPGLQKEAILVKESWELIEKISSQKVHNLKELPSVYKKTYNLIEKSEDLKAKVLMEKLFEKGN